MNHTAAWVVVNDCVIPLTDLVIVNALYPHCALKMQPELKNSIKLQNAELNCALYIHLNPTVSHTVHSLIFRVRKSLILYCYRQL